MKKKLPALMALMLAFCMLFTACSSMTGLTGEMDEQAAEPTETTNEEPTEEPTEDPAEELEDEPTEETQTPPDTGVSDPAPEEALPIGSSAYFREDQEEEPEEEPEEDVPEGMAVSVTMNGETSYYADLGAAWKAANENTSTEVTVKLHEDAIAVDGNFGDYGSLTVKARTAPLTVDLGSHTIDRALTAARSGGTVFTLDQAAEVTIKNGTIMQGYSQMQGGGIFVDNSDAVLTLEHVNVVANKSRYEGGGVFISSASQVNIIDCEIYNNETNLHGGGLYTTGNTSNVYLENVQIFQNFADYNGGGMYFYGSDSNITLKNVRVHYNYANDGGGIHWDGAGDDNDRMAKLTLSGEVVVMANSGQTTTHENLYINQAWNEHCYLTLDGLASTSRIGVSFERDEYGAFTGNLGDAAQTLKDYFFADNDGLTVTATDGVLSITTAESTKAGIYAQGAWHYFDSIQQAWTMANDESYTEYDCTLRLFDDWIAENGSLGEGTAFIDGALRPLERENDDTTLTFDLNGHTINRGLYDPDKGINNPRYNGCILYSGEEADDAEITIQNGTLTGGNDTECGGAICLNGSDSAKLTLEHVTIKRNRTSQAGGGIACFSCSLELTNVTITENRAAYKGGGIFFEADDAVIVMRGTNYIAGNTGASSCNNVYLTYQTTPAIQVYDFDFQNSWVGISKNINETQDPSLVKKLVNLGNAASESCMGAFFEDHGLTIRLFETQYITTSYSY